MLQIKRILLVSFGVALLASCTKEKLVYRDRIVEVPKIVFKDPPKIKAIKRPDYYIYKIDDNTPDDDVLNSVIISLKQLLDYNKKLEIAIDPYTEKPTDEER